MKNMKKLIRSLIIVCLLVAVAIVTPKAFAAISVNTKGKLTVTNLETSQDVTVNIYRLMTVNIDGDQP